MASKNAHGGSGRGQGRKPLTPGQPMIPVAIKMTAPQKEKLGRLGGAPWVRERIDKAKELAADQKSSSVQTGGGNPRPD